MRKLILFLLSLTLSASVSGQSCCDYNSVLPFYRMAYPAPILGISSSTFATCQMNASGESCAWVLTAPKTGNISAVHFRTSTVTTGDTVDVRLVAVDGTTGDPDNATLVAANTNCSVAIADGDDNVWKSCTLTSSAPVTQGDKIAVNIVMDDSPQDITLISRISGVSQNLNFPYADNFLSAAWGKASTGWLPIALGYSDGTYPSAPTMLPAMGSTVAVNTGTTPDELGNVYTFPFDVKVGGVIIQQNIGAVDYDLVIYDANNTVIATITVDTQLIDNNTNEDPGAYLFNKSVLFAKGRSYRVVAKATSASSTTFTKYTTDSNTPALRTAIDGGSYAMLTSRSDSGTWTDVNYEVMSMSLLIDGIRPGK